MDVDRQLQKALADLKKTQDELQRLQHSQLKYQEIFELLVELKTQYVELSIQKTEVTKMMTAVSDVLRGTAPEGPTIISELLQKIDSIQNRHENVEGAPAGYNSDESTFKTEQRHAVLSKPRMRYEEAGVTYEICRGCKNKFNFKVIRKHERDVHYVLKIEQENEKANDVLFL